MLGTEEDPGIMVLTLQELFYKIEENSIERDYKIKLWYLEIYNENIRDLLTNGDEYLDLREDPNKGISISNISEINVTSCKDVIQLLKKGNKNRTQEPTNANETSSRSHAILQVQIEYKDKFTGIDAEIRIGKLSLIDLAGSERASATNNRGIRLIEGANINRSLLTLGTCINALCEANEKGTKSHIPYRDSKLTRLLKVYNILI
jgi:kinesin family protein 18/19